MTISYAVTVCDEVEEIKKLLHHLKKNIRFNDDIVIFHDYSKKNDEIASYLDNLCNTSENISRYTDTFKGNFADWKNQLNRSCKGDWIFQIDADEIPSEYLLKNLHLILEDTEAEMITVPRVNTVKGITDAHIRRWAWRVNEKGWVNWPDYQTRIYKNHPNIKWDGKVHEKIQGFNTWASLDPEEKWCLYHPKTIERQEKQNNYYNTL